MVVQIWQWQEVPNQKMMAQAIKVAQDWLNKKSVVQAGWWNANRSLIDRDI